jgi:hypothetical protein
MIRRCRSEAFSASSRLFDLNGEASRARKRQNRVIINADVRRFAHVINTGGILGAQHSWLARAYGLAAEKVEACPGSTNSADFHRNQSHLGAVV